MNDNDKKETPTEFIFVDPKNDAAFRKIFGDENKKEILISFLNNILEFAGTTKEIRRAKSHLSLVSLKANIEAARVPKWAAKPTTSGFSVSSK